MFRPSLIFCLMLTLCACQPQTTATPPGKAAATATPSAGVAGTAPRTADSAIVSLPPSAASSAPGSAVGAASTASSAGSGAGKNEEMRAKTIASLMQAVFGKEYDAGSKIAYANLPDEEDRAHASRYALEGLGYTTLADGQTVLVANAQTEGEDGELVDSHGTGGLLNVFWLKPGQGQWKVTHKEENIISRGSNGMLGNVSFVQLPGQGAPATILEIESGGSWQGTSLSTLDLFHLKADALLHLTPEPISLNFDNNNGCGPETEVCRDISTHWKFAELPPAAKTGNAAPSGAALPVYPDLLLYFSGEEAQLLKTAAAKALMDDNPPRNSKKVGADAQYSFKNGRYVLVKGKNLADD